MRGKAAQGTAPKTTFLYVKSLLDAGGCGIEKAKEIITTDKEIHRQNKYK
jgi:hypothetical protein